MSKKNNSAELNDLSPNPVELAVNESIAPKKPAKRKTKKKSIVRKKRAVVSSPKVKTIASHQSAPANYSARGNSYKTIKSQSSSGHSGLVLALILVITVLVSALIVQNCDRCIFWNQNNDQDAGVANYQVPMGITINNTPTDPTADWQQYQSDNLPLQFKHPIAWNISENQGGISIATDWATTTILVIMEPIEEDLENYISQKEAGLKQQLTTISEKQRQLTGLSGVFKQQSLADVQLEQLNFYLPTTNGNVLFVSLTTPQTMQEIIDNYDLFLGSFELDSTVLSLIDENSTSTPEQSLE